MKEVVGFPWYRCSFEYVFQFVQFDCVWNHSSQPGTPKSNGMWEICSPRQTSIFRFFEDRSWITFGFFIVKLLHFPRHGLNLIMIIFTYISYIVYGIYTFLELHIYIYIYVYPRSARTIETIRFSPKSWLFELGNLNHPKLGTVVLIGFDFQGVYIYIIYIYIHVYIAPSNPSFGLSISLTWSCRCMRDEHCFLGR